MATISTPEIDVAFSANHGNWGTETAGAKLAHASSMSLTANFSTLFPNDIGFDNFYTEAIRTQKTVDISLTCDLSYHGQWIQAVAAVLGETDTPAEQNGGEGDYLHALELQNKNVSEFTTVSWRIEDDRTLSIPSVKWHSFTFNIPANGDATVTIDGIGDKIIVGSTNNTAALDALAYPTYQKAVLGGTNHYFRIDAYHVSTALSSADDMEILDTSFSVTRPMQRRYTLRGANSQYTLEPLQLSPTTGQLSFRLSENDDSNIDSFTQFLNENKLMAEIFLDGDQIGAGDNTSLKFQFPYLETHEMPGGHSFANNSSLMEESMTLNMIKAPAAPAGMTGVTNYIEFTSVDERTTSWI